MREPGRASGMVTVSSGARNDWHGSACMGVLIVNLDIRHDRGH